MIPHGQDEDPASLAKSVSIVPTAGAAKSLAVQIDRDGKQYLVGAKMDLEAELIRDWRRPMYNYESGKVTYGDYETDAYHLFVVEDDQSIHFAVTGVVKIMKSGRVLHEQFPAEFGLAFDGSPDMPGVGKMRYWEETVGK
ncbi:MAG: hypothetical protein HKN13_09565 [Rhodothermales bacterium]|nr:hypothetical protein [Rhodothermales bacterium]